MKRQYKQSVKLNGGIAIPLGNNYFYMKGRKHSTGGIDVDKNLEVEDGEIVHAGKKSTKVYSSLPFLNGISPVEKLLGGQNPNKVFAEQERFKDIHGINDDGTMKKKKAFVGMETKTKTDIPAGAKIGLELFTDAAQKEIQAKQDFNRHAKFLYNTKDDMGVNERIAEAFRFAKENANIRSHGHIGGKTIEARKKFWDSDKDIRQFTDSVAKSHNVDPHLLRASLSNEGIVDANIRERNMGHRHISSNDKNYVLGVTGKDFLNGTKLSDAYGLYGIDDSGTYYDKYKSMQNLIKNSGIDGEKRKLRYNEKDRIVHTIQGKNNAENIITHSATLKTIQDIIANQKRYKNIPKDSLNDLTLYHFNFGPNADTPVNVAKMRQGRYNAKNYKAMGGDNKNKTFEEWYKTVPKEINDTTNYNLKLAYEKLPLNELELWRNGKGHLRSVILNKDGNYEFLKSKQHPTYNKEIDWYNSDDAKEFRNNYYLDDSTKYPKYIRRNNNSKAMGGETKRRGLYSVTSNGQTKLYSYPSTGSETQNNRVVAEGGTLFPHLAKALRGGYSWKNVKRGAVAAADRVANYLLGEEPQDNTVVVSTEYKNGKKVTRRVKYSDYVKEQNNAGTFEKKYDPEYNPITNEYEVDNTKQTAGVNPVRIAKGIHSVAKFTRNVGKAIKNSNKVAASTRQAVAKYNSKPPVVKKEPKVNNGNLLPLSGVKRTANPYGVNVTSKPQLHYSIGQQVTPNTTPNLSVNPVENAKMYVATLAEAAKRKVGPNVSKAVNGVKQSVANFRNATQAAYNENPSAFKGIVGGTLGGYGLYQMNNYGMIWTPDTNNKQGVNPNQTQAVKASPNQTQGNTTKVTPKDTIHNYPKYLDEAVITGAKKNKVMPKNNIVINNKSSNNTVNTKATPNQTQAAKTSPNKTKNNKIKKSDITFDMRYNPLTKNEYNTYTNSTDRPTAKDLDPKTFNNVSKIDVKDTKKDNKDKSNWWNNKVKPWFKDSNNVADTIGLTSNFAGNLAAALINKKALDDMKYTDAPIPKVAAKLKTNYNINPALNNLREDLAAYNRNVDYNTESSQVALNRKRQAFAKTKEASDELRAFKENEQTKLINADKLNQQGVANENIGAYNSWREGKTNFDNTIREKRAENSIGLLNNFNLGIQDILTRRENRRKDLADAGLVLAAHPHVNTELLERFGVNIFGNKFKPKTTTNSIANTNNKFNPMYMPKLSEFKPDYDKYLKPGVR